MIGLLCRMILLIMINPPPLSPPSLPNLHINTLCMEAPLLFNAGSDSLLPNNLCCCRQLDSFRCKLLPNEKRLETFLFSPCITVKV